MATNIKSYEKDTLVDILKSKILLYKNIIKKTYLCYKGFIANNIFKTHELNQGINELESIQELLLGIHSEIEAEEDISVDDIIIKLQEINDKLSLTIKHYGTESINDMMLISFGIDYLQKNILIKDEIIEKYNFLNDSSNVLSYEVLNEEIDYENEDYEILSISNIELDVSSFNSKINGYKLTLKEKNQIIMINCLFKDIPLSYYIDNLVVKKINNIKKNIKKRDKVNKVIFSNFIESLSIKNLMINNESEIFELYLASITNASNIKNKLLSKLIRDFTNSELYIQRQIIIDLLLDMSDYESKYIAYLLYDMLSTDVNNNLDSTEQLILFNSFPNIIKSNFKNAMKSTIEYTKVLMDSDLENKLPLEQRICLLKVLSRSLLL